jgi:acetylcholinesterase
MADNLLVLLTWLLAVVALADSAARKSQPYVLLDEGTFTGLDAGLNFQFLGIPFTQSV